MVIAVNCDRKEMAKAKLLKRTETPPTPQLDVVTRRTIENHIRVLQAELGRLGVMRDLRRYSTPVTINNPKQVNIATDGGQQVNVAKDKPDDR